MVLDESMRLYPPAWILTRVATRDDVLCGHRVARGTMVICSPYVIHRSPSLWSEPERFDPDRFTLERSLGRPRYAHLPFGAGQRLCIGQSFAQVEMQLVLTLILQRFRFELAPGHLIVPEPLITMRPKHGVKLLLQLRSEPADPVRKPLPRAERAGPRPTRR
jgi:cytochrome P450